MRPLYVAVAIAIYGLTMAWAVQAQQPNRDQAMRLPPEVRARCLETLRLALKSDEFWPSMHAAEALTLAGETDELKAVLARRLLTETDDQHRCGLARELVRAGDRQKLAILAETLASPESTGRVHAAESLFKLGETVGGESLRAARQQTTNPQLQLWAAAALAKSGDVASLAQLRETINSDDRAIRNTAVFALARLGDKTDVEPLRRLLSTENDPIGQVILSGTLACLGSKDGRDALGGHLDSTEGFVRAVAADFVGASRSVEFQPKLVSLLNDPALDVRVRAAQSLIALSLPNNNPPRR